MPHIQIKSFSGEVLFEGDYADTRGAVVAAAKSGANLRGADLSRAVLHGANLSGTDLCGANLRGADLSRAVLHGANLSGACLSGANLHGTDLHGAYLHGACLYGANLSGACLHGACLYGTDLSRTNLRGADLSRAVLHERITATGAPARRATRADGFEVFLWPTSAGWRVAAGCRFFTMDEAWRHWEQTRGNTSLGDESHDILTMFELHIQRVGGPGHE